MSDRVRHVEADLATADLGGPYDAALCFNIIHHLSPEQIRALFARIRAVLRPGSPLCVLDLYDRPGGQRANLLAARPIAHRSPPARRAASASRCGCGTSWCPAAHPPSR